jgi:chromosome segregation ATPase
LKEELERERQGHQEILRRAEGLEQEQAELSGVQQEAERLRKERQRLAEDLEKEREERVEMQRRTERQELELARLKQEIRRSQAEPNHRKRAAARDGATESGATRPWWRRPLLLVGLLLGVLIAWFTSLAVALNVLAA